MKIIVKIIFVSLCAVTSISYGQSIKYAARYFDNPIVVDSSSTLIIPTLYNTDFTYTNKIAYWGYYYANIIFYNFETDSSKKLFVKDTYIRGFRNYYRSDFKEENYFANKWVLYQVKDVDGNKNGRIDERDPTILYVSTIHGDSLKALTTRDVNVEDVQIFKKQNIALVKIQRDLDNDGDFELEDKDYFYVKLDLTTLTFGKNIEVQ